jgi:hypothetical protein
MGERTVTASAVMLGIVLPLLGGLILLVGSGLF